MVATNGQRMAATVEKPVIKRENRVIAKYEVEVAKCAREEYRSLVIFLLHGRQIR